MKNFERGKLAAIVFGAALVLGFASCDTSTSGGGDEPNDKPTSYTVTIASGIENGTVTASPTSAEAGETVTLTLAAGEGYALDTLTVKDAGNADVTTTEVIEGESYTFTMPESDITVTATFRKTVSEKLGKFASPYEVGDIVFNDGSAIPYTDGLSLIPEQKEAAIAIIFYKGLECSNDSASRTLGVGLKHGSNLKWCTNSANAYNTNIETIQCPASGSAGALTFTGYKNGSDNLKQIGDFLKDHSSTDDTDTPANYSAFYFAKNYASQDGSRVNGTSYANDWYLPSIAELFQIWKNKATVDAASKLCGGNEFGTNRYWSSSQYASSDYDAYLLNFGDGDWYYYKKFCYIDLYVCAVQEFN